MASGIFMLPVSLAAFGSISLLGWLISTSGAILLAVVFSNLSRWIPGADGGPYAFTREGLGPFAGFLVAWSYWLSIWSTNAAISVAFVSYLGVLVPSINGNVPVSLAIAVSAVWFLTWVNARGIPVAGTVQLLTTILKIVPLLLIGVMGIWLVDISNFKEFNVSGMGDFGAITATATLTLFAFLGIEAATIPAGSIDRPEVNVPKATLLGTMLVAAVYILSSVAIMGLIPQEELMRSDAPFSDAAGRLFGEYGRYIVAAGAAISTFGALNGWILVQGQMPAAAAADGVLPAWFGKKNYKGVPAGSLVSSSVLITGLLVLNFSGRLSDVFESIILLSTTTVLIGYLLSTTSCIILSYRFSPKGLSRGILIAVSIGAFLFSLWAMAGAGTEAFFWGMLSVLAGIPLYTLRSRRYS